MTGFNDDPFAVGDTLASLTAGTEDTASIFNIDELTQGYDDDDTLDLNRSISTAYKIVNGITTEEIIGTFAPVMQNGVLTSYEYTPSLEFVGDLEVKYIVSDSKGPGIAGSSYLTINAINDDPIATFAVDQVASEGGDVISGQLTATDTEVLLAKMMPLPSPMLWLVMLFLV